VKRALFALCTSLVVGGCVARDLPYIARDGDSAVNEALARGHADVNERAGGKTALHVAAEQGDARTIRVLLTHHADVGAYDSDGRTALGIAALRGHAECAAALLAAGADPTQPNGRMQLRAVHEATLAFYGHRPDGAPLRGGPRPVTKHCCRRVAPFA
jgi:ankyrin repeat protein